MTEASKVPLARGFSSGSLDKNPLLAQWVNLDQDGVVELRVGKVEFGQGIGTALAQIAAEELDVDPARIRLAAISTGASPDEGVTSGSLSVQHSGDAVRRVCATLREMAVSAFCARHDLPPEAVQVDDGQLRAAHPAAHPAAHFAATATYWTLDLQAALAQGVSPTAAPKPAARYGTVGTSLPRRDLLPKLFGQRVFIQDLLLPGVLHGRVVRMANPTAVLIDVDVGALQPRFAGVTVVRDGSFLGVLAEREEQAVAAAAALAEVARWELPASMPDSARVPDFLRSTPSQRHQVERLGDGEAPAATMTLRARYARPFIAHASIGPSCALAHWHGDGLEVWSHSQGIYNLKADIQVYLRRDHPARDAERVVVHHVEGSGCYGHNPADDVAFDAVLLARHAGGRPVRVLWSRADELGCGPFGPAHLVALSADLDAEGRVTDWQHHIWANGYTARPGRSAPGQLSFLGASQIENPFIAPISLDPPMSAGGGSDRNAVALYDFPRQDVVTHRLLEMPVRTSAIRALGGYGNVWAIESFMDELAHASGQDPIAFRLAHLKDARARAVIARAVDAAPWWHDKTQDAEGTGRGLAFARYKNTGAWCAVAVRIVAERSVRVLDISIAADLGLVINPDGAANQLEGGAIQSCSWTLHEEVAFSRDRITSCSWADYPILSFSETPAVRVSLIDQPGEAPLGAGEAAQGPTAAAIGNAVFDALGIRIRQLPITPARILSAASSHSNDGDTP